MGKNSIEKQNYANNPKVLFTKSGYTRPDLNKLAIFDYNKTCPKDKTAIFIDKIHNKAVVDAEEKFSEKAAANFKKALILNKAKEHNEAIERSTLRINGKIENFSQGPVYDCWVLTGARALASPTNGAEIIKNSISQNKNGRVTVKLPGYNESYTFKSKQIIKAEDRLSSGDDDARVIEMAVEQHRLKLVKSGYNILEENKNDLIDPDSPLDIGNAGEIFTALTGRNYDLLSEVEPIESSTTDWADHFSSKKNNEKYLSLIQKNPDKYATSISFLKERGPMLYAHAYSIKSVDNYSVNIVNPLNTSKEVKILKPDFLDNCSEMIMLDTSKKNK